MKERMKKKNTHNTTYTEKKIAYTTREIRDIFIFYVTNEAMIFVM